MYAQFQAKHAQMSVVPEIRTLDPATFRFTGAPRNYHEDDEPDLAILKNRHSPGIIERLVGVAKDNFKSVAITGILVLVVLLETALDSALFVCPCSTVNRINLGYSVVYIVAPSVALLVVGILGNNTTWRLVTGCWYRSAETKHGFQRTCILIVDILSKALLAPAAWVIFAFIDGRFYVCAVAEDPCGLAINTTSTSRPSVKEARQEAQIIGYSSLIAVTGFILFCILFKKGCSRHTYEREDYIQIYRHIERVEMQRQMEEQAQSVASRVVKAFLYKQRREKSDWDKIAHINSKGEHFGPGLVGPDSPSSTPLQKIFRQENQVRDERLVTVDTQTDFGEDETDQHF